MLVRDMIGNLIFVDNYADADVCVSSSNWGLWVSGCIPLVNGCRELINVRFTSKEKTLNYLRGIRQVRGEFTIFDMTKRLSNIGLV